MSRCEDCGCGMNDGFCSNCHEEVYIAEQYADLGQDCPSHIHNKAIEQMNDEERIKQHEKQIAQKHNEERQNEIEMYGETKLSKIIIPT